MINTTAPLHNGSLTTRQWVPARRAAFGHKPWGWKGERLLRWRRRQLHKPSSQRRGHATKVQVQVAHRKTYEKHYTNSCIIILDCLVVWSELCLHSTQALPKTCQSYIAWCFLVVGCCIQCTGISYNQKPLHSRLHLVPVLVALSGSKRGGTKLLNVVLESLDWEKQKIGQRVASVVLPRRTATLLWEARRLEHRGTQSLLSYQVLLGRTGASFAHPALPASMPLWMIVCICSLRVATAQFPDQAILQ